MTSTIIKKHINEELDNVDHGGVDTPIMLISEKDGSSKDHSRVLKLIDNYKQYIAISEGIEKFDAKAYKPIIELPKLKKIDRQLR